MIIRAVDGAISLDPVHETVPYLVLQVDDGPAVRLTRLQVVDLILGLGAYAYADQLRKMAERTGSVDREGKQ